MPIRKSDDISNESNSKYDRLKTKRANIEERIDDSSHNDNPYDDAIQYLAKKIDECVDAVNTNTSKNGISTAQAAAIVVNTAKTGITTSQTNAITANTAKTGISDTQTNLLTALGKGLTLNKMGLTISKDRDNNLVITDGESNWIIAAAR